MTPIPLGLDSPVSEFLGEAQPGWRSATVALVTVTALAFVLTAGAERALGLKKNGRPRSRRMRRNGATTRVVVTLEPNGRYTGHVLDRETGRTLAVTHAEESAFVAKREADRMANGIERHRAKLERRRPQGPHRVTPTGVVIRLVPRGKKP